MLFSRNNSVARCDTSAAGLKRVLKASAIALRGPKRGTNPIAMAAGGADNAAREAIIPVTWDNTSILQFFLGF